ncbi:MAG: DUF309 domain-containing protein [Spirulinaceae cyanobacterium RM2_2_10]|nr:DUF309 domain-containing protein [Spirulinaceae cyanobacterium SM2_1_0]NJO21582.1 DUF309 domain-containing protein [Spirulinaceae cyanobacterium RM2_2_10]
MVNSALERGIDEFNRGDFYACHDTLEALWMEAEDAERGFYQGILQIAVACYHLENANWRGAVTLLGEGTRRLRSYSPEHAGVQVARLREVGGQLLTRLQQLEPAAIAEFATTCQEHPFPLPKIDRTTAPEG